jgi:hypothetical protein
MTQHQSPERPTLPKRELEPEFKLPVITDEMLRECGIEPRREVFVMTVEEMRKQFGEEK